MDTETCHFFLSLLPVRIYLTFSFALCMTSTYTMVFYQIPTLHLSYFLQSKVKYLTMPLLASVKGELLLPTLSLPSKLPASANTIASDKVTCLCQHYRFRQSSLPLPALSLQTKLPASANTIASDKVTCLCQHYRFRQSYLPLPTLSL
jgi:hypothetical protein